MTKTEKVKLYFYEHLPNKNTIIDSFEAKEWDDFVLVLFNPTAIDSPEIEALSLQCNDMFPGKKVLLIPNNLDIEFYGVETKEDES